MEKRGIRILKSYKSPVLKFYAMKNHSIVILLLFYIHLATTTFALSNSVLGAKNPVTELTEGSGLVQAVETSLVSHIWESANTTYLFHERGLVSQITNGSHTQVQWWEVYAEDGQAYLKLYSEKGETRFQITAQDNTQWVALANNTPLAMKATPIHAATARTTAMRNLVGTWSSTMYPSHLIAHMESEQGKSIVSVDFRYSIKANGTFQKTLRVNGAVHQAKAGIWQLSADGNYFILHFDNEDKSFQTYVVKVKHLSLDELVLDQALVTCELESKICGQMNTFFFNKR